jgi:hypothetical protein
MDEKRSWRWVLYLQWRWRYDAQRKAGRGPARAWLCVAAGAFW